MKKELIILSNILILILTMTLISAEELTFNRFEKANFFQDCDCTFVNITSIIEVNGNNATSLSFPVSMTKVGNHFNYSYGNGFKKIGNYIITFDGNPNGIRTPAIAYFKVKMNDSNIFKLNFDDNINLILVACIVVLIVVFIIMKLFTFGGILLFILGLLLLFNGYSFIISILCLLGGMFFSISKK